MKHIQGLDIPQTLQELCDPKRMALVVYDMQIGIEPTARHAADFGIVPIVVEDACGSGHAEAAQRSIEALKFAGDAVFTDIAAFRNALAR
jgi:nicotinamidase-related amidase